MTTKKMVCPVQPTKKIILTRNINDTNFSILERIVNKFKKQHPNSQCKITSCRTHRNGYYYYAQLYCSALKPREQYNREMKKYKDDMAEYNNNKQEKERIRKEEETKRKELQKLERVNKLTKDIDKLVKALGYTKEEAKLFLDSSSGSK